MSPDEASELLADALERALDRDDQRVRRLARAGTSVRFVVEGTRECVTLLLDRRPPECVPGDEPAEIEIRLTPVQAVRMAAGALKLPAALVHRHVTASGPVRRYMEIDVILRSLLEEQSDFSAPDDDAVASAPSGPIDPGLLAIETRGVRKSFGRNTILDGVDLTIPEGVVSVILGPSGTGKSVMLQHIIGLMQPDEGEIRIRGRSLTGMSRSELMAMRQGIGVMFQDGALFSAMDVFDNVAFPLREHTDLDDDEIVDAVLTRLCEVGLEDAADRLPSQLSGGMKKRAGLARALVLEPSIVLCDEPDSGLDPVRTALLADLLKEEHAGGGGAMIVVTHNIALARHVADHISVLWQGRILESAMAEDILASETPFVRQFLAGEAHGPLTME